MGEAAKAVPTTAAPLMKVLLDIFFTADPFFYPPVRGVREEIRTLKK